MKEFKVTHTDKGSVITKKDLKGLYILVVVTDEFKLLSYTRKQVEENWGDFICEGIEEHWAK